MSKIGDKARARLDELYARHGKLNIGSGKITLDDRGWQDFLSIQEFAIVDRGAELPRILVDPKFTRVEIVKQFKDILRKEHWAKEIKDENIGL